MNTSSFFRILLFLFAASLSTAATLKTDIEYGRAGDVPLLLDASIPEGDGPFPVAILIHGGGWSSGDKSGSLKPGGGDDVTPWFGILRDAHFVYFSINYRLAPTHRWPAGFDDVQTAIRWVKAHAVEYKGDPHRVALFGHSAGGHLACLAAVQATPETAVQAVVGFAAVTDLEADTATRGAPSKSLQWLFNLPPQTTPEVLATLRAASPLQQLHAGPLPAFLLLHGDADKTVPLAQSVAFQKKLRELGATCDLIVIPGAPHRLIGWETFDPNYGQKLTAWLEKTLGRSVAK